MTDSRGALLATALCVLATLTASGATARAQPAPTSGAVVPRFESTVCWKTIPPTLSARCGFLVVPENRTRRNGKTIRVAVAIVPAASKAPDPTPLVYVDGGPGGAPLLYPQIRIESGLNADRDLILVDQRGTYYSQPQLTCPAMDRFFARLPSLVYDAASTRKEHVAAVAACRAQFVAKGVDLAAYNTTENAADFADLRRTLGYKQWNIWGTSYGTNLAMNLVRTDPAAVRSLVLDSTEPPDLVALPAFWAQASYGFAHLFAACSAQRACSARYGDVGTRFTHLVNTLEAHPVTARVTSPATKQSASVTTDGGALANWLVGMSFLTAQFKDVPLWIDQMASGKPQAIAASRLAQVTPPGLVGYGLTFGVICSEWYPSSQYAQILADGRKALPGYPASVLEEPPQFTFVTDDCRVWNVPKAPPAVRARVRSPIPTLFLAGTFDAVTAVPWAKAAASGFPNARVLVFPAIGHGVTHASRCAQRVVNSFFANPSVPDTSCIANVHPPLFATR